MINQIERYNNNLPKHKTVLSASDLLLIQNGGITYSDFLDMLEAVFTPSGGGDIKIICGRRVGTGGGEITCGRRI